MSKVCPTTGTKVLYSECLECEDKACRKVYPTEIHIGTKIYTIEQWTGRIVKAEITGFKQENNGPKYAELKGLYEIDDDPDTDTFGIFGALYETLFLTKEECIQYQENKNQNEQNKYEKEIHNIEELVVFCLKNCVSSGAEEYTNYNARAAAIKKAKEMGIVIEE